MKTDKRKFNGGPRPGSGPKEKAPKEKKIQIYFGVKAKHVQKAIELIQPIVNEINED